MISIKEYASNNKISYEAARKQVIKYKDDLEPYLFKVGRTQYLGDEAVKILDEKRNTNNIIFVSNDKNEQIEILKNENKALLFKIAELQDQVIKEKNQVQLLQNDKINLLNNRNKKGNFISLFFRRK